MNCEVDCVHCHEMIESGNDRYSIYYCDWFREEADLGALCEWYKESKE